uniref:Kazal-like domain-containing protein n=1 Tax=Anabas testudineus TaxID=64144 RepID=A0A7N6AQH8_ANATE
MCAQRDILAQELKCSEGLESGVCSVLGKTYGNECLLHKEACRKRRHIGLAHTGPCLGKHTQH